MNAVTSVLTSSRFNRAFSWLAAAVLIAGLAFGIFKVLDSGDSGNSGALPALKTPKPVPVNKSIMPFTKLEPGAQTTIKKFLVDAVNLKNLGAAYFLVNANVRNGSTHKMWKRGESTVIPVGFRNLDDLTFRVKYAKANERDVQVDFPAFRGVSPQTMYIALKKSGQRWLVDYWGPIWQPPLPAIPNA